MNRELQRFIRTFRELEQKTFDMSKEERERWQQLKQKLTAHRQELPVYGGSRSIAVASLYPGAGASFIAANYAWSQAARGETVVLSEMPGAPPYLTFAMDTENRETSRLDRTLFDGDAGRYYLLQSGRLLVRAETPTDRVQTVSHTDAAKWFLAQSKEASLLVVDVSSHWPGDLAEWVADWVDELWVVVDSDWAALTRKILTESFPDSWSKYDRKIRMIANKWTESLDKPRLLKKLAGTLAVWGLAELGRGRFGIVPFIDPDQVNQARLAGRLYLEMHPEGWSVFEQLGKGGDP